MRSAPRRHPLTRRFKLTSCSLASFTRHINKAISFCCANGEVAPFVGHNAFMRWSAVQDSCFVDPDDGWTKMWSESHVSEGTSARSSFARLRG